MCGEQCWGPGSTLVVHVGAESHALCVRLSSVFAAHGWFCSRDRRGMGAKQSGRLLLPFTPCPPLLARVGDETFILQCSYTLVRTCGCVPLSFLALALSGDAFVPQFGRGRTNPPQPDAPGPMSAPRFITARAHPFLRSFACLCVASYAVCARVRSGVRIFHPRSMLPHIGRWMISWQWVTPVKLLG